MAGELKDVPKEFQVKLQYTVGLWNAFLKYICIFFMKKLCVLGIFRMVFCQLSWVATAFSLQEIWEK